MKLILKRSQAQEKGLLGRHKGTKFILSCRVELTPEEEALIAKYNLEDDKYSAVYPSTIKQTSAYGEHKFEMEDIARLIDMENSIKEECENFKSLLNLMSTYDGEDIIEFK